MTIKIKMTERKSQERKDIGMKYELQKSVSKYDYCKTLHFSQMNLLTSTFILYDIVYEST